MRVEILENLSALASFLASSTDLKRIQIHTVYSEILGQINLLRVNSLVWWQRTSLSSSSKALLVIWPQSLPEAIQVLEDNRRFLALLISNKGRYSAIPTLCSTGNCLALAELEENGCVVYASTIMQ